MRLSLILVIAGIFLAGCQTTGGNQAVAPGVGPVKMSKRSFDSFTSYMDSKDPIAFALSEDGRTSSWYYCIEFGCRPYRTLHLAITQCNLRSKGIPCHIFARQRDIVWENPGDWKPLSAADPVAGENLNGKSVTNIDATRLYAQYNQAIVGQKAFAEARAESGDLVAVGTATGRLTVRSALDQALDACTKRASDSTAECRIVEINNEPVGDSAGAEIRKNADRFVSTALPQGRQTIAVLVDWDGVAPGVTADLTYYVPEREGSFFLRLPQGAGLCTGTMAFSSETRAVWSMACDKEIRAEGTFARISPDPVYEGKGLDSEGRQIRFLSVRSQG